MIVAREPWRFTGDDYHGVIETGIVPEDNRGGLLPPTLTLVEFAVRENLG